MSGSRKRWHFELARVNNKMKDDADYSARTKTARREQNQVGNSPPEKAGEFREREMNLSLKKTGRSLVVVMCPPLATAAETNGAKLLVQRKLVAPGAPGARAANAQSQTLHWDASFNFTSKCVC
jgi:hypothetical protein